MPALVALARVFHEESPIHSPFAFDEAQLETLLEAALGSEDWLVQMVIEKDELVGASLTYVMPTFFGPMKESGDLAFYVLPQWRGSKAAILLIDGILEWAKMVGALRFTMGIHTGIDHDRTLAFLLRKGFTKAGDLAAFDLS
jgi:GNAT superfamily N-acetyltransferase